MREAEQIISGPTPIPVQEPDVNQIPADINFYLAQIELLSEGQWFNFNSRETTAKRLCLSVILSEGSKFVFTDTQGNKQCERSAIGLAIALRDGQLAPLESEQLIERALKNVAESTLTELDR